MNFWQQLFICLLGGILGGSGTCFAILKTLVRSEARKELKEDIEKLHQRANTIEKDFVRCEYCKMQHDNVTTYFKSIDNKLEILIKKGE